MIIFEFQRYNYMQKDHQEQASRNLRVNVGNDEYLSNQVKTTSSNIITFIPLNLFNQLTNMANIYFILICILQVIPSISVTNGTPTQLIPLSAVIFLVMLKDAYEEYYRYKKDKQQNERLVEVWQNGRFQEKEWQSIKVGHVVKIRKQEKSNLIPCDLLIIHTSDSQNKAYVETKGLDGQTNLKIKSSFLMNIPNMSQYASQAYKKQYEVNYSLPNQYFSEFNGSVNFKQGSKSVTIPVSHDNLILRGCISKNVLEVIGVCVYAGKETKLFLNSVQFKVKKSKLMQNINTMVFQILIWQILIALVCSIFNTLLQNTYNEIPKNLSISNYWIVASTWWLLMTYFVPISLMVTMEMVKLFQGIALESDQRGFSQRYDCFTIANNSSVNENLGQINYVFTDKTGTLTKNIMTFKYLICDGLLYGGNGDAEMKESKAVDVKKSATASVQDRRLINSGNKYINESLKLLSVCHDIYVQKQGDKIVYNSSSPDEKAIIEFAKLCNYELLGEKNKIISVAQGADNRKQVVKYEKFALLEFNSIRKRMSVIVKDPQTNQTVIYTKGADSIIADLLKKNEPKLKETQDIVNKLSDQGLRTLLMAKRVIPAEQFNRWKQVYNKAKSMIGRDREQAINKCYDSIECNLQLVGATAIEDELQDQVSETIKTMRLAGMTFFILTGDKRQTAINIGRSCGLVDSDAQILDIPPYDPSKQKEFIFEIKKLDQIKEKKVFMLNAAKIIPTKLPNGQIICYRCTPDNKKQIVQYYKVNFPGSLTMAVGDGANDVNMITQADVGIGIKGFEGTQAARVADFTAGQFKFIKLLTLYYGRQWYRKNTELALYSFFKNWFHVASVITLGGFTFFSGVMIFNTYLYELYNVIFTSWPIIIWSIFDQEYTYEQSNSDPELYRPGLTDQKFNQTVFLKTIGKAMIYGIAILLLVINVLESQVLDENGNIGYMKLSGYVLYGIVIMIVNFRIILMTTGVKPFIFIISILSIATYWVSQSIYFSFINPQESSILSEQFKYPSIFFVQLIAIFFFIFIQFGIRKYQEFNYIFKIQKSKDLSRKLKQIQMYQSKEYEKELKRFIVEDYLN